MLHILTNVLKERTTVVLMLRVITPREPTTVCLNQVIMEMDRNVGVLDLVMAHNENV